MRLKDDAGFKESGIPWCPMVPSNWKVLRFKEIFSYTTGVTPDSKNDSYFEVENGDTWITIGDMNDKVVIESKLNLSRKALSEFAPPLTTKGSLLFSFKLSIGKVSFAGKDLYTNEAIASIKPSDMYDLRFWYYYLPLVLHGNAIENIYGAKMLNQGIIVNMLMGVPALNGQNRMAVYLDEKTAAIDARVAVLEKKLAAYTRLKTSMINEAVTKGLDKSVPMKDSGVEWIGRIPEGWELIRVKDDYFLKGRIGWQGLKAEEFIDQGPWLITGTDFRNGHIDWSTCYHISEARYRQDVELQIKEHDLLLTKDGTVGKLAYIDYVPGLCSLNSHLLMMRPLTERISNRYMYWLLSSCVFRQFIEYESNGSTMQSLSQESVSQFIYALPSSKEQRRVADHLDAVCAKIDKAAAIVEKQIDAYKRLKRSLINEVVTGSRKVA